MDKSNSIIRNKLNENNKPLHWLAHIMGLSEQTIVRWLRYELPEAKQKEILEAIDNALNEER